jgi:hypothetical protein
VVILSDGFFPREAAVLLEELGNESGEYTPVNYGPMTDTGKNGAGSEKREKRKEKREKRKEKREKRKEKREKRKEKRENLASLIVRNSQSDGRIYEGLIRKSGILRNCQKTLRIADLPVGSDPISSQTPSSGARTHAVSDWQGRARNRA